jgi:cell wall-associated NlpC family hydrolase
MSPLHRIRGTQVCRATALCVTTVVIAAGLSVVAASNASARPVYPSADQVAKAKQAVSSAATTVHGLEASLAVATSRLEALQTQVQIAAEAYDLAKFELDQRTAAANAAAKQAAVAAAAADAAESDVGQLAVDSYYDGRTFGGLEVLVGATTPQELLQSAASYRIANTVVEQTFQRARASRVVATTMKRQADSARAQQAAAAAKLERARQAVQDKADVAAAQTAAIGAQRAQMIVQLAALRKTSVQLETQRQQGLEAERRARAEAARRAAAKRAAAEQRRKAAAERRRQEQAHQGSSNGGSGGGSSNGGSGGGDNGGSTGSSGGGSSQGSSSGGSAAANWALTQLGKPYEWAADGPSTYDCSGLTMKAWAQAGVYLPHSSVMQYAMTQHVSYGDLRKGDLIFFATNTSDPGTIHHVAIYIGGGRMVEAPYTGANVRTSSIYRSDRMPYAGRP